MAKTIPLFVFFIFLLLLLAGCMAKTSRTIIKIERASPSGQCAYTIDAAENDIVFFIDSCGKYKVGDTLK